MGNWRETIPDAEKPMSVIDEILKANEEYATHHKLQHISPRPKRRISILTCMDTRLSMHVMGLVDGDAHIIRNAGGIVTEDSLRSLLISHYLLGTEEFMIITHTDCGLNKLKEDDLRTKIERFTGTAAVSPARFYSFDNPEEETRIQLQKMRSHPWVPKNVPVRGFVYSVESGRLKEIFL